MRIARVPASPARTSRSREPGPRGGGGPGRPSTPRGACRNRRGACRVRHRPRRGLSASERLHRVPQVIGLARLEVNRLTDRAVTFEIELDHMVAGLDAQTLREAIEVVDRARKISVDVDLGLPRRHLHAGRAGRDESGAVVAAGPSPGPPPAVAPERVVVVVGCVPTARIDHRAHDPDMTATTLCGGVRWIQRQRDQAHAEGESDTKATRHGKDLRQAGAIRTSKSSANTSQPNGARCGRAIWISCDSVRSRPVSF